MAWSRMLFMLAREYATSRVLAGARDRVVSIYAGVVNGVRRSLLIAFVVAGLLQLMALGLVGAIVTAVLLWGGDDKLAWLLVIFGALFTLPLGLVAFLMSERTWLRASGAGPRE